MQLWDTDCSFSKATGRLLGSMPPGRTRLQISNSKLARYCIRATAQLERTECSALTRSRFLLLVG